MITHRKQERHDTQTEQASTHLSDSAVVDLLSVPEATKKESHAKDEKQVGQDGAKQRSLYDADLVLDQSDDEDDQFHSVSEGDIEQCTEAVAETTSHALGGVTEQTGQRNDGNCVQCEDDRGT